MELVKQIQIVKRNQSAKFLDDETCERHDRNIFTVKEAKKKFPALASKSEELLDRAEAEGFFVKTVVFESRGRLEACFLVCTKKGNDWVLV